jgi:hypothetical protein
MGSPQVEPESKLRRTKRPLCAASTNRTLTVVRSDVAIPKAGPVVTPTGSLQPLAGGSAGGTGSTETDGNRCVRHPVGEATGREEGVADGGETVGEGTATTGEGVSCGDWVTVEVGSGVRDGAGPGLSDEVG